MSNGPILRRPQVSPPAANDPSTIPAFDRVMRGLIRVPKSELPADKRKNGKQPKKR